MARLRTGVRRTLDQAAARLFCNLLTNTCPDLIALARILGKGNHLLPVSGKRLKLLYWRDLPQTLPQNDGHYLHVTLFVALEQPRQFVTIDELRCEKIRTDQQQSDIALVQRLENLFFPVVTRTQPLVIPGTN